jgi:hypothetical protein
MSSPARILHQLLETDRMIGVEAAPRARFPAAQVAPAAAARPAAVRSAPAPARPAPAASPARPPLPPASSAPASPGSAAWRLALEAPLGQASTATAPVEVLFVSVEWGQPLTGEIRALFDRQVAAMKVAPTAAGLLRLSWPGAAEPDAHALAEAKARILAAVSAHTPRVAVLLGGFSAKAATGAASLLLARGRWFNLGSPENPCAACATWHPSQLGMDRDRRAQTWDDLQKAMAKLAS